MKNLIKCTARFFSFLLISFTQIKSNGTAHSFLLLRLRQSTAHQVSRSQHKSNGDSEEQVCNCQFRVTWTHGPEIGKHATVPAENICLIQKSLIDDPVLEDFIDNARKSLKERTGNLDSQGRNSGLNPPVSSHGASPHPASELELIDVSSSDGSHHHEVCINGCGISENMRECHG